MKWNGFDVSANISLLFAELPYPDRFAAAAAAGFTRVETWWPFGTADPGADELDGFAGRLREAGITLTGLNFFAGDMTGGERGIACQPERAAELAANLGAVRRLAEATGCRHFNLLHGQLDADVDPDEQHQTAVGSYRSAAAAVADLGGTVLVEPLARGLNGSYPLTTHTEVVQLLDEVGVGSVALLLDTFHLGMNGVDVARAVLASADRIGHVQVADVDARCEPGSGVLAWEDIAGALRTVGYHGVVGAEYEPAAATTAGLGWLDTAPSTRADRAGSPAG